MKKSFILLMLIVVACLHQGGNVLNAQIDKCPHPIDTVVVTAQYAPGSVENAVHKVKVIGQEKIESMGAQNLRDVLSNEMNIRLSQDNILGSNMSIQGISGQNVKIMVDGVPVSGRLNGSIDLSQINLYNVERIEIVDGPLSVNYGTDALAGTVNIITKKGQARKFSFSNELYYESIGQYNANARLGLRKGRTVLALSGGRNFFDGWRNNDPLFYYNLNPVADSTRHADWKPKEQYFANLMLARYFKQLKLSLNSDFFNERVTNRGLPRLPYGENAFDDIYKTIRLSNALNLKGQLGQRHYLNAMLAYTDFVRTKNTFYKDLTTLEEIADSEPGGQDTSTFRNLLSRTSISTIRDSSKINFELGYDINLEQASGIRIKNTQQSIGDFALFGSAEYRPIKRLVIRPGLRVMHNTAYKAPPVPSLNVKYLIGKNLSMRFSYARGFRSPSLKELYFYFVDVNHYIAGNPNLRAEYSHNFNFSTSESFKLGKNTLKIENSLFFNRIENMISLAQNGDNRFSYFNLEKHQTLGVQAQVEFNTANYTVSIAGLYTGRYNQLSESHIGETFTYSPEARCNIMYRWPKAKLSANLYYKYTGMLPSFMLDENGGAIRTQIQAYNMADLSVTKKLFNDRVGITAGCKNLFNVRNITGISNGSAHSASQSSIAIGTGRNFFVRLEYQLDSRE
ncbi:MAG: TonB-dependent receptor [Bacteroidia bacterium]|nr:TonB-dependent receptor [Bacteroidia bacterium]